MEPLWIAALVVLFLIILIWTGLRISPAPFSAAQESLSAPENCPLPPGLPEPVERFYRATYGDSLPLIRTAILSGRGSMAPFGLRLPMRFRFVYRCGSPDLQYRSNIEMTFFGMPILRAEETCQDGRAVGRMPAGVDQGAWFDQAMNIRIWCELLSWLPAVLISDPRVHWSAVDSQTALLSVPFGEGRETVVVRFAPQTGLIRYFEAMKHRSQADKELWINAIWMDQGKPWLYLNIEETRLNPDVGPALSAPTWQVR